MEHLFNSEDVSSVIQRVQALSPDSSKQWGKMNVSQMLAHCTVGLETAMGRNKTTRIPVLFRWIGTMMRKSALGDPPFKKNSPTDKTFIFTDERTFREEQEKLIRVLEEFRDRGPASCTSDPHPFFGHFTPEEWARIQWKHMDHHLRQFGA